MAALATVALGAAGCGGSSGPASATLTHTGCAFDGDSTPPAGPYTVKLANQAAKDGSFAIGSIAQDSTVDEAFMAEQRRRIANGKAPAGPPAYYTENVALSLPKDTRSQMTGNLQAGKHLRAHLPHRERQGPAADALCGVPARGLGVGSSHRARVDAAPPIP